MATFNNRIKIAKRRGEVAKQLESITARLADKDLDPDVRQTLLEMHQELDHKLKSKMGNKLTAHEGEVFHSKLELYMHKRLEAEGIRSARQVPIVLMEGFKLYGEPVRPITIIVDFIVDGFAFVDVKGDRTDKFKMKWKMLKDKYRDKMEYHLPSSVKKIDELIEFIKQRTDIEDEPNT